MTNASLPRTDSSGLMKVSPFANSYTVVCMTVMPSSAAISSASSGYARPDSSTRVLRPASSIVLMLGSLRKCGAFFAEQFRGVSSFSVLPVGVGLRGVAAARAIGRVCGGAAGSFPRYPACHVALTTARDAERPGRDVLVDDRAGCGICAVADGDRRDEHGVRADADVVADRRVMLRDAVVVDEDGGRADVGLLEFGGAHV